MDHPSEFQEKILENRTLSESTKQKVIENFKEANKKVHELRHLKGKNRVIEQQELVEKLKESYHSYRNMSHMSGIPLKSLHKWCSHPSKREHKAKQITKLRKKEFEDFLLQDSISFTHPAKFHGKRFLHDTLEVIRKKYLLQSQYHTHGVISMSSMKAYRPSYIMLCNQISLDQCLCNKCENFKQLLKSLHAAGIKNVPSKRYHAVDSVVCDERILQEGSEISFAKCDCIFGNCEHCGECGLHEKILQSNQDVFNQNRTITWHQWLPRPGKSIPEKCQIKGTIRQATNAMLELLKPLKGHLFRANWNRNIFQYIRSNLLQGYVVQIFDFAMNFRNMYQDEVQAAYWDGSQTAIHAVINYFLWSNDN